MIKKLLLVITILTLNILNINAQIVTEVEANDIAMKFMNAEETVLVKTIGDADVVNLFIFNTENGFVIVSGDKNEEPVVAFSENRTFDADNIPSNFSCMLDQYSDWVGGSSCLGVSRTVVYEISAETVAANIIHKIVKK